MAVLQMQKLCICALKKDRKSLMEFLQAAGVLELTAEAEPDEVFKRTDTLEDRQKFERNAATADRALEVLAAVVPEETSMLAGLAGKPLAKAGAYRETEANAEALLGQAERILNLQKQITEEKTVALRLLAEAESLKPWQKLEIPLAYQETKRCAILAGAVGGGAYTQEEIYASVAKQEPQLEKWELEVVGSDADQTCIAVICLKEDEEKLETALRSIGFARPARPVEEVPAAYAKKLKAQAAEHEGRAAATEEELKQCAPAREDLKLLSDYYRLRAQKYEALGEILQSEKTCMITGFIPKRDAKGLEEKLNSRFELAVESSDVPEDEEAPVLLSNGTFAASAEGVTASFGLPAKGEMDPTGIMAACYVFLFGLMLSDAATKAFVLSYSRALREELRPRRIGVTAVCPGPVKTEFFDIAETTGEIPLYKRLVMADPHKVVKLAICDCMAGKSVSVYGVWMKAFFVLCKVVPHEWILRAMQALNH